MLSEEINEDRDALALISEVKGELTKGEGRTNVLIAGLKQRGERIDELEAANSKLAVKLKGLRKRIHILEGHNQYFHRCESPWCNPSADNDPADDFGGVLK